jgi:Cu-processing system permease protein
MLSRIAVIALNTYREAVRARILHGLFALAIATGGYCLVVGAYALHDSMRVTSDLGSASISLYGIIVAVVLGATSLYRELELKTIYPVLSRPLRRWEYVVAKFLGTVLTLTAFVAANTGALLLALSQEAGRALWQVLAAGLGSVGIAVLLGWRLPRWRTYLPIGWALVLSLVGWLLAADAPDDRRVLMGSAVLTLCEVGVVVAITTLFASFSSPFLTAVFTFGLFIVGRSADTLARLPEKVFGQAIKDIGEALSRVVPNLMVYVPPRPLLTGEAAGTPLGEYLLLAAAQSVAWAVGLLAVASLIFQRRSFP